MRKFFWLLLPLGLLLNRAASAQAGQPAGKWVVDKQLVSHFIKQARLLHRAAVSQRFKKTTEPVDSSWYPAPGDRVVTYCAKGDTIIFYQSGRTSELIRCSISSPSRYASAVPFLASSKEALFAGKYKSYNAFTITESAVNGQYLLGLTFQNSRLRRLTFDIDWSSW